MAGRRRRRRSRRRACSSPTRRRRPLRAARRALRHQRAVQRAALAAGAAGDHPGRRLATRAASSPPPAPMRSSAATPSLEDGPGVLRRRQGSPGPLRPRTPTTSRCCRRRRSSSPTPTPRPHELAAEVRRQQVSGPTAIKLLEQLWNRDLSDYDPDGPLPDVDPDDEAELDRARVAPACGCTPTDGAWPTSGGPSPTPRSCRSAS